MSTVYDGDFTAEAATGTPELSRDFPLLLDATSFTQPMMVLAASYAALADNAQTSYRSATWYYAGDGGFTDEGAGVISFNREWVRVPSSFSEYERGAYTFPALEDQRMENSMVAMTKIDTSFYLVGASPATYATSAEIPQIADTRITNSGGTVSFNILAGGFYIPLTGSSPTLATYTGWMATDLATATSYSIVAEASSIFNYKGNVWGRKTRYVKAT